jgi:uncharacterized protein (DUF2147 family)
MGKMNPVRILFSGLLLVVLAAANLPAQAPPDFSPVIGTWTRVQGGYELEIKAIEASGKMKVAYLNPRAGRYIHIAEAKATSDQGAINIFVKMEDRDYPGSYYQLSLDKKNNNLNGKYFHAPSGKIMDVTFTKGAK